MQPKRTAQKTMIVGAFDKVVAADQAVRELRQAGFEEHQIGVVCSEKCRDQLMERAGVTRVIWVPEKV